MQRIMMLSVHTSPLARLGGEKTGGMNVYVRELARELGARGYHVDIFTRRADEQSPAVDHRVGHNVRVINVEVGEPSYLAPEQIYPLVQEFTAAVVAFSILHNLSYDIIYSHYWISGLVAGILKNMWNIPFVQMFHTLGHMKNRITPGFVQPTLPDLRIRSETKIVDQADLVLAATPAEQAQLLWLYRADRRKISIIPPGVNPDLFSPVTMQEAKSHLHIDDSTNQFLFVGRIEPLKAVDTILEAIATLVKQSPALRKQLQLLVVGGNPENQNQELKRLHNLTQQFTITDLVRFIGAKDQQNLRYYYAASLAVVVPSDYESFGLVALEAMATGVPVIATQVGGLAFLVQDNISGYLIPVRDSSALAERMRSMIDDPSATLQMRQGAINAAREYTWDAIASRIEKAFIDLIKLRKLPVTPHTHSEHQPL
jgi:D-inositol-3-phosphate glycosyltransferase